MFNFLILGFQYIPELIRLELANCLIDSIETNTFYTIPSIQVITLSGNKLKK